jgi:hypothetical protein
MHLRILEENKSYYSSEAVLTQSLGYGTYTFYVKGDVSSFDPNVVLGLFTYDLAFNLSPDYFHREIDFEIAQWGQSDINNSHFALQGPLPLQALHRFNLTYTGDVIASFNWSSDGVKFKLRKDDLGNEIIAEWDYNGNLTPVPGNERVRMNLWVFNESRVRDTEVVVKRFEFRKN